MQTLLAATLCIQTLGLLQALHIVGYLSFVSVASIQELLPNSKSIEKFLFDINQ